jgi:hypothetical protein
VTAAELERRLFELLGGWAPEVPEPEAKLLFRVHSFRHAAHAERLAEVGFDGSAGLEAVAALVEEVVEEADDTQSRLFGAYRVILPALVAGYAGAQTSAPAIARALDEILAEDEVDVQEGQGLLAKLSSEPMHAEGAERA